MAARAAARLRRRSLQRRVRWRRLLPPAVKRGIDGAAAASLIVALAPVLTALAVACRGQLQFCQRIGRGGKPFAQIRFRLPNARWAARLERWGFAELPVLWNVLRGDLALIGPRALSPAEHDRVLHSRRHEDRPGLICLWWIRRRANIDYEVELEVDREYIETSSLGADLGIALRALWTAFWSAESERPGPVDIAVMGIPLRNVDLATAVKEVGAQLCSSRKPAQYCFVNADCANLARRSADYLACLNASAANFADGIGVRLAARLLGLAVRQNVNGTDLFPRLLSQMGAARQSLYLLGGEPGVAESVARWIEQRYPDVRVCGQRSGYFSSDEEPQVIRSVAESGADLLLAGLGAPRQDLWIRRNLERLGVRAAIGVGGLFDFYSGRRRRAPQWLRELGLEWAFRLWLEPRRLWRRYVIGNVVFLTRAALHAAPWRQA